MRCARTRRRKGGTPTTCLFEIFTREARFKSAIVNPEK